MTLWQDFRYALRLLRRSPSLSAIIVVTLGLCIGANTAIFSVIDATLLRPLPYPQPDRLASVVRHFRGHGAEEDDSGQTGANWELVRDHASFLDVAAEGSADGVNFASGGTAQYVQQQRVGAGFFRVLGVAPLIGREFTREEDRPGGPAVVVLSYEFWQRVFRGAGAVGRSIMLRGEPYMVIGVMPEGFRTDAAADLWTPLRPSTSGEGGGSNYEIVARLKPGVTWAQADGQMEAIGAPAVAEMKLSKEVSARFHLISLQQSETADVRRPILIAWAAVGLVLLIGCANVASLLLARAGARSREIATRMALGGGRRAVARQLLVESFVLAILGGAAGLLAGFAGLRALQVLAANTFPIPEAMRLDGRVLAATGCLALLCSLFAGVFPALEASGVDIRAALTEAGTRGVAGTRKRWTRRMLVSGEVALAVLLLIGAGLLIRTLTHLYQLRPGFDPANVITASFSLQDARYSTARKVNQLFDGGLAQIRGLPGVESAAVGLTLPYERGLNNGFRRIDGPEAGAEDLITDMNYVTPDYFRTLHIPLLRGRDFRASDGATSAAVAIVNEAFARKYLSKQEPVGSHLGMESTTVEIVGLVGTVQETANWGHFGPLAGVPMMYVPASQVPDNGMRLVHVWFPPHWVVRAAGPAENVTRGIQHVAETIDPLLPISAFRTIQELRSRSLGEQRFHATLLATLSGLALLLAVIGLYGLMAQSVMERRREMGIRLALGSSLARAIRDAALPGVLLALTGVAAGCVLAGLSVRVLESQLWGVTTTDSLTFVSVPLTLLFIAALASVIPALRIAKLNPADTLRDE
jgi:predicted permease